MSFTIDMQELANKLQAARERPSTATAMLGFDGYVDYIQKAVQTSTKDTPAYFESLSDFGKHIVSAAGKSAQVELRTAVTKFGGNAPIMAHALARVGIRNYCVGTMGYPVLHDSFRELHEHCTVLSIGEPAITNALEFGDGKLILSETSTFKDIDLHYIHRLCGNDFLDKAIEESGLIAMVDWANLPNCTALWDQLCDHMAAIAVKEKLFFFDLCDPSKKSGQEIRQVLGVIGRYRRLGKTILGLNENEALKLYRALRDPGVTSDEGAEEELPVPLTEVSKFIFDRTDIDVLLVHPVNCALLATDSGVIELPGKVVGRPKILTGGGDNLNAGFCFGLLNDFSLEESALLGMATSGAYVSSGYSPTIADLITYLNSW